MESSYGELVEGYTTSVKERRANKREGQHFLMDRAIADMEASYGERGTSLRWAPGWESSLRHYAGGRRSHKQWRRIMGSLEDWSTR